MGTPKNGGNLQMDSMILTIAISHGMTWVMCPMCGDELKPHGLDEKLETFQANLLAHINHAHTADFYADKSPVLSNMVEYRQWVQYQQWLNEQSGQ